MNDGATEDYSILRVIPAEETILTVQNVMDNHT